MALSLTAWLWICTHLSPLVRGTHPDILREGDGLGEADTMETRVERQHRLALHDIAALQLRASSPRDLDSERLTVPFLF